MRKRTSSLLWMAIPLSQGLYTLVDSEDYEWLNQWKWCAEKRRNNFYAARKSPRPYREHILMHRLILNPPDGFESDHINHCGLDNRRENLRACTNAQNSQNRRTRKGGTSQYKGVYWHKGQKYKGRQYQGKWSARIQHFNKPLYLGEFDDEIEAAKTYDAKAKELFGEFANTNF